jgi:hypothetical protein
MYPLNMKTAGDQPGFAVANDEAEHAALSELGYLPKLEVAEESVDTEGEGVMSKAEVMAELDKAGIEYDKRWGLERLKSLLPA